MTKKKRSDAADQLTIHKSDSETAIRDTLEKAAHKKNKKGINIDQYFGKVNFGDNGLNYQKKLRNEWE